MVQMVQSSCYQCIVRSDSSRPLFIARFNPILIEWAILSEWWIKVNVVFIALSDNAKLIECFFTFRAENQLFSLARMVNCVEWRHDASLSSCGQRERTKLTTINYTESYQSKEQYKLQCRTYHSISKHFKSLLVARNRCFLKKRHPTLQKPARFVDKQRE